MVLNDLSDERAGQRWIAERYAAHGRFVSDLAEPLIDLLNPKPNELILDLGCGDGALTQKIALRGTRVIGVDSSLDQILATKKRGVSALVMDGHKLGFKGVFDGILTNAALHWMVKPSSVIVELRDSLKFGGRLVGEMGGVGNIATIVRALTESMKSRKLENEFIFPWYFPETKEYQKLLETHGFVVKFIQLIKRPTPLPGDFSAWLQTFGEPFLFALSFEDRKEFVSEVTSKLKPILYDPYGKWVADYVRLRFLAVRN